MQQYESRPPSPQRRQSDALRPESLGRVDSDTFERTRRRSYRRSRSAQPYQRQPSPPRYASPRYDDWQTPLPERPRHTHFGGKEPAFAQRLPDERRGFDRSREAASTFRNVREKLEDILQYRTDADFDVSWSLLDFMASQYPRGANVELEDVICLVGDLGDTQATTCETYVKKTWPRYGPYALYALTQALKSRTHKYTVRLTHGDITVQINATSVKVNVRGRESFLIEVGEVLVWVSSVCRAGTLDGNIQGCKPVLRRGPERRICEIRRPRFEQYLGHHVGTTDSCWKSLFNDPVIAEGYAVNRRDQHHFGLELEWEMMVALAQVSSAIQEDGCMLLVGINSILVPVDEDFTSCVWHLLADGDRKIDYSQAARLAMPGAPKSVDQWLLHLSTKRHFVGWTAEAVTLFGSSEVPYNINSSGMDKSGAGFWRIASATLGGGQYVTANMSFVRGQKDVPAYIKNVVSYEDKIHEASRKSMIFHDTSTRQSWLLDAASGLLHLCRARLSSSETPDSREARRLFNHANLFGDDERAALEALLDPHNRASQLSTKSDPDRVERKINLDTGDIEKILLKSEQAETWGEYVEARWDNVQEIYSDQARLRTSSGLTDGLSFSNSIQGYEFMEVAAGASPLYRRKASVGSEAGAWRKLLKNNDCILLLGAGFDQLIKKSTRGQSGRRRKEINRLAPMVAGSLVAPVYVLQMLSSQCGRCTDGTVKLGKSLYWEKPESVFHPCDTCGGYCAPELARLKSSHYDGREVLGQSTLDRFRSGAVIFGTGGVACREGQQAVPRHHPRRQSTASRSPRIQPRRGDDGGLRVPSTERSRRRHASSVPDLSRSDQRHDESATGSNTRDQQNSPQSAISRSHSDSGLRGRITSPVTVTTPKSNVSGGIHIAFDITIPSIMINDLYYRQDTNAIRQNRPQYVKIHRDYLFTDSLRHYGIPYFLDPAENEYIFIERDLTAAETDALFEHTRITRANEGLGNRPWR